jgi:ankyrin repeat protein
MGRCVWSFFSVCPLFKAFFVDFKIGLLRYFLQVTTTTFETGSTEAHHAAQTGNVWKLKKIAEKDETLLHKEDSNGWQPLHEGARAGHTNVVEYLVGTGMDINKRTNDGIGGTALHFARESHGASHGVVKLLESLGALDIGPEL